ncbi:MAG: hypothetical protein PHU42_03195 [Patescibacteria group bacterium]|nr:hypothetical protein [Patescibacteria group bacterium]
MKKKAIIVALRKVCSNPKKFIKNVSDTVREIAERELPRYGKTEITCRQILDETGSDFANADLVSGAVINIIAKHGGEIYVDRNCFIKIDVGKNPDDLYTFTLHRIKKTGPSRYDK